MESTTTFYSQLKRYPHNNSSNPFKINADLGDQVLAFAIQGLKCLLYKGYRMELIMLQILLKLDDEIDHRSFRKKTDHALVGVKLQKKLLNVLENLVI